MPPRMHRIETPHSAMQHNLRVHEVTVLCGSLYLEVGTFDRCDPKPDYQHSVNSMLWKGASGEGGGGAGGVAHNGCFSPDHA